MEHLTTYLPLDRCQTLIEGGNLPERTSGAALVADISGFTPLTEALLQTFGPRRGAEALTHQLNLVYDALIPKIHAYRGSVITFGGDAIICWFDGDDGLRATACGLAMQRVMLAFAGTTTSAGMTISLSMKVAIAAGPVRRLLIGDPQIQVMDVIAGSTLDRLSAAEELAHTGEVVLTAETVAPLQQHLTVARWYTAPASEGRFAVVESLTQPVTIEPWPALALQAAELDVQPWILPPVYERLKAGQGQFLAEIRPAVALFLCFSGIDYDNDETSGVRLDAYIRRVQNILSRYEGFLLQVIMGDKGSYLYAAFGAPLAHDDDPSRAVAAALDLLDLPAEFSYIQHVQIGITRGLMHAGAYGSTARRTYGVLGDEVNLAARLMARARPGQILVSGRIAFSIIQTYDLHSMGLIQVKGKKEPVPVWLVEGRKQPGLPASVPILMNPLVGRERELALFDQMLNTVLAGSGQIMRLEGAAGIGKSHLSAAFGQRAAQQGLRVALGTCQSISQNIAYGPWRQIFLGLFGLLETRKADPPAASRTPELADAAGVPVHPLDTRIVQVETLLAQMNPEWLLRLPLLGDLLGMPVPDNPTTAAFDPRLRQEALFALAVDLLQTWAHEQPLLLVLEDMHWMDEASLGLTLALGRVAAHMPILLTLVHRPAPHGDQPLLPELASLPGYQVLNLGELMPEAAAALINTRLRAPVSALALSLIQSEAQGNPFFIEELVDMLRETGKLVQQPGGTWTLSDQVISALRDAQCLMKNESGDWLLDAKAPLAAAQLGIPDSIHGIVLSRLDRLPESHKLTLKVASVIGRIFEVDVLEQVHPAHPTHETLLEEIRMVEERDFARLDMPTPHLTYIFKHSVTHEVAYDTLLDAQRRDLHSAVGAALEHLQPEAIEQLAYHYSRSGQRDKTLFYLDKAAHKAQHEYANETALAYYTQALDLQENWEWRRGQIEILHILGRRDEQQAALYALERVNHTPLSVVTQLWSQYYEAIGDYARAQSAVERSLADCRNCADVLCEARALAQLGSIAYRQGDYEQAGEWYTRALSLFEYAAPRAEDAPQSFVEMLNGLGHVYRQQGNLERARACFEQALHESRVRGHRKGEANVLNNLGIMFSYERDFSEALSYYQQALELQRAIGDRAGEGASLGNMAQVIQEMGHYGRASEYLSAALTIQQAIGNRWGQINNWNDQGLLYQELGDLARAQACLQQGLALSKEIGDEAGQAYILANLGLVAYDRGDLQTAAALMDEGLHLARTQDDKYLISGFLSYRGMVSLQAGQTSQAIEQASAALELRSELGLRLDTTHSLATLAAAHLRAGDSQQALDYAQQALDILEECGGEGPEAPQRDYFICAQVFAAVGRPAAATRTVQAAYNLVLARASKIVDPALRRSFLERVPINQQIVQAMRERSQLITDDDLSTGY